MVFLVDENSSEKFEMSAYHDRSFKMADPAIVAPPGPCGGTPNYVANVYRYPLHII